MLYSVVLQVRDLGKQVTVLVREVEASRSDRGGFGRSPMACPSVQQQRQDLNQSMDSDSVISGRLLEFSSVSELQQRNIELLTVVRELSAGREASEVRLVEERTAELREELKTAASQLDQLREARQRQQALVESLIVERDMYKTLATNVQQEQRRRQEEQERSAMAAPPAAT